MVHYYCNEGSEDCSMSSSSIVKAFDKSNSSRIVLSQASFCLRSRIIWAFMTLSVIVVFCTLQSHAGDLLSSDGVRRSEVVRPQVLSLLRKEGTLFRFSTSGTLNVENFDDIFYSHRA